MLSIDIHTHILPERWPDLAARYGYGGFVRLEHHKPCCARMMQDDKSSREVPDNCWDPAARLRRAPAQIRPVRGAGAEPHAGGCAATGPGRLTASASANCSTAIGDLARTLGPAKITLGSDYLFPLGEPQSGQLIRSRPFGDDTKARLPGQNALD